MDHHPEGRLTGSTRNAATSYSFRGELWQYPEEAGWHFITLPQDLAEELRDDAAPFRKGFGSVKVSASVARDEVDVELELGLGS